jgi:REP element-mobilizing transposase RayT
MSFEEFVDERMLVSHNVFGDKEMKIKILEVSDEHPPVQWKFGNRVKVNKILITIKHLNSQQVEEGEFDIANIEKELSERSHYTSTNRWVSVNDIKNGYVVNSKHTNLISDAVALEYIVF